MSREAAIVRAEAYFDGGAFKADLARRVAIPTESQNPERTGSLRAISIAKCDRRWRQLGFTCRVLRTQRRAGPLLYAERIEDPALPTVLGYGHGDVIRGLDAGWQRGLVALDAHREGRPLLRPRRRRQQGPAHDQHRGAGGRAGERGKLGFNAKWLIEMGEETGSPGLREVCAEHRALFAADVLVASDGPRLTADRPTIFARHARRLPDRPVDRCARRRAPFGQLGRAALQPGDPACACARRPSPGRPDKSAFPNGCLTGHSGLGAARASRIARSSRGRRSRRSIRPGASPD